MSMRMMVTAVCLLFANSVGAQMFKCTDARGATQYSDKPCAADSKGKEVGIRGKPPASGKQPVAGKPAPQRVDPKVAERELQRQQALREERFKNLTAANEKQRRCASLRDQMQRVSAMRRPAEKAGDAHDAHIAKLHADVARACSS